MGKLLDKRLVIIGADLKTSEACIRSMADLFEQYGYVQSGYADAVVVREKEYPTGLPGKGINIAIPHTNNHFVNAPAVGVIIPKEPVVFSMMGMKEKQLSCELILPLVVKDSRQQLTMLKKMMGIIRDGELLQKIKNSRDADEVLQCLASLEEP